MDSALLMKDYGCTDWIEIGDYILGHTNGADSVRDRIPDGPVVFALRLAMADRPLAKKVTLAAYFGEAEQLFQRKAISRFGDGDHLIGAQRRWPLV